MKINNERILKKVDIPDENTDLNDIANDYWNSVLDNYAKIL